MLNSLRRTRSMLQGAQRQPERMRAVETLSFTEMSSDLTSYFLLREALEAYDLVGIGLGIVDEQQRWSHCNRVAADIFADRDGLELTPQRTLRFARPRSGAARGLFEHMREANVYAERDREQVAILAVPRPSGKRPLTLLMRLSDLMSDPSHSGSPTVLAFIVDPERPMKGMHSYVQRFYRLTAAESELATLLMQGLTLPECCEHIGIRRSTAATHLRQLFNKTQVRTQSQLVSELFRRFGLLNSPFGPVQPGTTPGLSATLAFSSRKNDLQAPSFAVSFIRR